MSNGCGVSVVDILHFISGAMIWKLSSQQGVSFHVMKSVNMVSSFKRFLDLEPRSSLIGQLCFILSSSDMNQTCWHFLGAIMVEATRKGKSWVLFEDAGRHYMYVWTMGTRPFPVWLAPYVFLGSSAFSVIWNVPVLKIIDGPYHISYISRWCLERDTCWGGPCTLALIRLYN